MIKRTCVLAAAVGLMLATWLTLVRNVVAQQTPIVAVASSLRLAVSDVADAYREKTGKAVKFSFGATGNLVRQIEEGAPFSLFLAADEASAERLVRNGKTAGAAQILVEGRLALAIAKDRQIPADADLQGLKQAQTRRTIRAFAIANPKLAPYGKAAQQALERAGLWEDMRGQIVMAQNVGQAVQFVASGAADAGLVAESLLKAPSVSDAVKHVPVDTSLYDPVRQAMVLLKPENAGARAFQTFLHSSEAEAIFSRYGFRVPEH